MHNSLYLHIKTFLGIYQKIDEEFQMNIAKYDTICCKLCFHLLICNELFCNDQENQLLMITNTLNKPQFVFAWLLLVFILNPLISAPV